jgi:hypothetical protein
MRGTTTGTLLMGLLLLGACERGERLEYLLENEGQPVGRLTVTIQPAGEDSTRQEVTARGTVRLRAMGREVAIRRDDTATLDARTGELLALTRRTRMGDDLDRRAELVTTADSLLMHASDGTERRLARAPDLVVDDGLHYRWLLDGLAAGADTLRCRSVDIDRGVVHHLVAVPAGRDSVVVDGTTVSVRRALLWYPAQSAPERLWLDPQDGRMVRRIGSDGFVVARGRLASGQSFTTVELDSMIMAPVDTYIADERAIRAMTVRAIIDTPGAALTPADLQAPGQSFTGTVVGRRIDGVFAIAHRPFDPRRSPPFPTPPVAPADSLRPYLRPSPLIESDDPEIVRLADELTTGATTRWDAVQRLARWVSEEIGYDIPGGGSAVNTLRLRRGECGAHTRLLAALCRAVDIPARMVIGGFYFHDAGGHFGQHAWTELHLGEAGWVPLDATIGEWEVLDSGHIRLVEAAGFEPVHLKILSFELASDRISD